MSSWSFSSEKQAAKPAHEQDAVGLGRSPQRTLAPSDPLLEKCVHELFEAQAARSPDAIAVVCKKQALTYGQLNALADRFAWRLRQAGVGADALVGLCVEPSLELAVGLLGILKAGGAYLPLDSLYPTERLDTLLRDANPRVIAVQRHLASRFSNSSAPLLVFENGTVPAGSNETSQKEINPHRARSDNLAYVTFTSGSTGRPKGVLIPHRSLVNHGAAMQRYYDLKGSDRVLQFASLSFDVAAEEIFPTWLSGATVVLWPETFRAVPVKAFLAFVEEQGITIVNLPTSYWEEWVRQLDEVGMPSSLRFVIVGSEKVPLKTFSVWHKKVGARPRWCNAYGPSEATITATVYEPNSRHLAVRGDSVPIGKPITNTEVYVLDKNLNQLPTGSPGELHIGGRGLARGYLNRPDLTAEKFIANPFSQDPQSRLYKTGDLVCCLADGNLEFLGRVDDQVKIRGYRIELGEVETALRRHPAIGNAVVAVKKGMRIQRSLVAYWVARADPAPSPEELKNFLRRHLPDYMVPASFVRLERLPLTSSGKVDRAALPEPSQHNQAFGEIALPRDGLERELAGLWEKILAVEPIGIRDNFFDLGGHSLLVLRLISQIERKLHIDLPVSAVQQAPTIEQLALIVRQKKRGASRGSRLLAAQTSGSKPPMFFYGGSVQLARYLGTDQPYYLLESHGLDGWSAPSTVEEMADETVAAIRSIQTRGPYFLAGYSFGGLVIYEVAQRLRQQGEKVALMVLIDPCVPRVPLPGETLVGEPPAPTHPYREFIYHFRNLTRLDFREKLDYVAVRMRGRARMLRDATKRIACEAYLKRGYRLPALFRMFYFMELSARAIERYKPEAYQNPFIVLHRPEASTGAEWRCLAGDKVEFHDLDAEHLDIIQEPYVSILAGKLNSFLEKAHNAAVARITSFLLASPSLLIADTVCNL